MDLSDETDVYLRDTLELEHILVSEACRPLVEGREGIEIVSGPAPLCFDERGRATVVAVRPTSPCAPLAGAG